MSGALVAGEEIGAAGAGEENGAGGAGRHCQAERGPWAARGGESRKVKDGHHAYLTFVVTIVHGKEGWQNSTFGGSGGGQPQMG